jgi:hypothetical protein
VLVELVDQVVVVATATVRQDQMDLVVAVAVPRMVAVAVTQVATVVMAM